MQRQLRPFRRLQLRVKSRLANSFREHQGIVDAILAGDSEGAAERLRAHVTVQGQRFSDLVTSLDDLSAKRSSKPAAPKDARARELNGSAAGRTNGAELN